MAQLFLAINLLDRLLVLDATAFLALQGGPLVRAVLARHAQVLDVVIDDRQQHGTLSRHILGDGRDASDGIKVLRQHLRVGIGGKGGGLILSKGRKGEQTDSSGKNRCSHVGGSYKIHDELIEWEPSTNA